MAVELVMRYWHVWSVFTPSSFQISTCIEALPQHCLLATITKLSLGSYSFEHFISLSNKTTVWSEINTWL